jgi:hypothetical protein
MNEEGRIMKEELLDLNHHAFILQPFDFMLALAFDSSPDLA